MFSTRRLRVAAGLAVSALVAVVAVSTGTLGERASRRRSSSGRTQTAYPAVTQVATAWGRAKGVTVQVVQKQSGPIRQELSTVAVDTAPDVIVGAHDWVGELSGNGSIIPLSPSAATKKQFPAYALNAFSYGTAIKKLYGAPVALENIALVTNTKLAKAPKSFADLEKQALAAKKKTKAQVGLAVQQGAGRRVPHVPVLLRARRLRLRHEQGRQPRSVGHRRRQPEVPEERGADRQVEQGRPHPLAGQRRHREGPVPEGQGRVLGHGPLVPRRHPEVRRQVRGSRRFRRSSAGSSRSRSSASRATW